MMCGKVTCDAPGCKSYADLSAVDDLRNVRDALERRGWLTSYPRTGSKTIHLCPAHSEMVRREGWSVVRARLEGGTPVEKETPTAE